jgi:hypothetical protein
LRTLCRMACRVYSLPKFCVPKFPKKLIVVAFNALSAMNAKVVSPPHSRQGLVGVLSAG